MTAFGVAMAVMTAAAPAEAVRGRHAKPKASSGGGSSSGPVKVGVLNFTGPGEAASRAAASQALSSKKIVVVPGAELNATAKQLHVRFDDDSGFRAVAKQLNLTGFVAGEVSKNKATLTVRTGSDGSVVGEESFAGSDPKSVAAAISKTFWKRLAGAFNKTNPPSGGGGGGIAEEPSGSSSSEPEPSSSSGRSEEPTPAAEPERPRRKVAESSEGGDEGSSRPAKAKPAKATKAAESEESGETPGDHPAVDVAIGAGDMLRSLSYTDLRNDLTDTNKLAKYSVPSAPVLAGKFDLFPFALMGDDSFLADVGLAVDFAYLLPVVTSPGMGGSYKTASLAWAAGPKIRLPMGLFVTAAYGDRWYKLTRSNSNMAPAPVPSTDYRFVRIGGGIRHMVTDSINLGANIAYDQCLGKPGQIATADFFPNTTCAGLELGAMVGYRVADSIELRGGVDVQRFGLAFHSKPSDNDGHHPIAGGALDQYTTIYVNVAYVMGGSSSGGGDAEKAPSDKSDSSGKSDEGDDDGGDDDDSN